MAGKGKASKGGNMDTRPGEGERATGEVLGPFFRSPSSVAREPDDVRVFGQEGGKGVHEGGGKEDVAVFTE